MLFISSTTKNRTISFFFAFLINFTFFSLKRTIFFHFLSKFRFNLNQTFYQEPILWKIRWWKRIFTAELEKIFFFLLTKYDWKKSAWTLFFRHCKKVDCSGCVSSSFSMIHNNGLNKFLLLGLFDSGPAGSFTEIKGLCENRAGKFICKYKNRL